MRQTLTGFSIATLIAFALLVGATTNLATAGDAACPDGDESMKCKAEASDKFALYVVGREAYEEARESGDFSEALRLARKLDATGDRNGDRLVKMVYLQLGWGGHSDYVEAYVWLNEGLEGGKDYLDSWISRLADKMTAEQLSEAKALVGS